MFLKYIQIPCGEGTVHTWAEILAALGGTYPGWPGVQLQADGANIRFTMDNVTIPHGNLGMLLLTTEPPTTYLIEDLQRIKFTAVSPGGAHLNLHFFDGRNI